MNGIIVVDSSEVKTELYLKIMVVGGRGEKSRLKLIFLSLSQNINRYQVIISFATQKNTSNYH